MRTTRSTRSSRSTRSPRSTRLAASAAVAALVLALSACGSDDGSATEADESSPSTSASASPSESADTGETATTEPTEPAEPAGPSIDVSVEGDTVTPNAETLEVEAGEPLTLRISSDRAGELHVHAKPEQYVDFEEGNTETELVIETPGSVEIEEHESGAVIALLTVR